MKIIYSVLLISVFLLCSCGSETKRSDFLEIPVDIDQDFSLALSEIAEEIVTIDLELTDESLINPDRIGCVLLCEDYVIVAERGKILVFDKEGKFVRLIGRRGQGPGEYTSIHSVALDKKNKRLFVCGGRKIVCYDLDGSFVQESGIPDWSVPDMNYINDELLLFADQLNKTDEKGLFNHAAMYRMNNDLQVMDSCTIRRVYFERPAFVIPDHADFVLYNNSTVYLYCIASYVQEYQIPEEVVLRDTLYRFENNQLIPELRLGFRNDGIDGNGNKFIHLANIYRSSRYVFSRYHNLQKDHNHFLFCYDTKTGKGYNMQDGYTDDIHQIEGRVNIRPFSFDTEMFYYLHTPIDPDNLEEPNPTLYIGKLKK